MTIQKVLDEATILKAETVALKTENITLVNAQKQSIHVLSEGLSIYTAIAKTSLNSCFSNISSVLSELTVSSTYTDTSYCTINMFWANVTEKTKVNLITVREVIKKEIYKQQGKENWRCITVMRNIKNHNHIWIMSKDVQKTKIIKKAAEKIIMSGSRVLRDQLYLIKVDNVYKDNVLSAEGLLLLRIIESLRKKNEASVAKMTWINRKNNSKVYRFMIVYLHRDSDVNRLLQEDYFHVNDKLKFINVFERCSKPDQCYNCQSINHKTYNCKKTAVCVRCVTKEHNHNNCNATLKCVPCDGPHESYSKNCWVLYSFCNE